MELVVGRAVDPKSLNVTIRLADPEITAAIDGADPDDLAFKLWLVPVSDFTKSEYVNLVAQLVAKVEQAASLGLSASPPEPK